MLHRQVKHRPRPKQLHVIVGNITDAALNRYLTETNNTICIRGTINDMSKLCLFDLDS